MNVQRMVLLAGLGFTLLACATSRTEWFNPSNPARSIQGDNFECGQLAETAYARVMNANSSPGAINTNCARYGNQIQCQSVQSPMNTPLNTPGGAAVIGQAAGARDYAYSSCMASRGWQTRQVPR